MSHPPICADRRTAHSSPTATGPNDRWIRPECAVAVRRLRVGSGSGDWWTVSPRGRRRVPRGADIRHWPAAVGTGQSRRPGRVSGRDRESPARAARSRQFTAALAALRAVTQRGRLGRGSTAAIQSTAHHSNAATPPNQQHTMGTPPISCVAQPPSLSVPITAY